MATILVAGGAGFIGSHTVLELDRAGHKVIVLDDLSNGHADSVLAGEFIKGSIHDRALLDRLFQKNAVDAVIHFAAFIEAGESMVNPMAFYHNNVAGSLTLIEAMVDAGVRRLVFSSTAAVYGQPETDGALRETLPKFPINPYGQSKWAVECMIRDVATTGALDAYALRYFNAAGSDPDGRIGERHDPETHLIPLVLDAALGTRAEIKIFGTDYTTMDGTCIRDYIHVCDLATAHGSAVEKLLARPDQTSGFYDALNLGIGTGYSVRQVVETVRAITGKDFTVTEVARRPGDPATLVADAARAHEALNWAPKYPELSAMIEHAWRFRQKHGKHA
jgi:UDP-glucose 4-epimerase